MLRATLKSLAARKLRLGMSAFAIVIGVAFVVGSYVFTDTLNRTFDDIFGGLSPDVVVEPEAPEGFDMFTAAFGAQGTTVVPADVVDTVAAIPGVARADGEVESSNVYVLDREEKVVGVAGAPGIGVNWHDGPSAGGDAVLSVVDGRVPERSGEVMLDDQTIEKTGYRLGDQIPMITLGDEPRISAELVGITRFGADGSLAGASLAVFDTATAQELFLEGADAFSRVAITAAPGTSAEELRESVATALPDSLVARTGAEVDEETASTVEESLGFFTTFLLVFAAIALFVGVFLILNTFSILVAQRSRELALLRALGAGRRQVTRSVLVEALVVGVVGATLGLLVGVGVAALLQAMFAAFGMDFGGDLVLRPRTVLVAYAVGVLVTMLAAYAPARRASRVPPVAAMREDAALPSSSRRTSGTVGATLVVTGAGLLLLGAFDVVPEPVWFVGVGILGVIVGVALLAPLLAGPLLRVVAGWYPRAFGMVGRLARENAIRNPRRTAATASALMIGLTLVTALAILGASANKSIERALDDGLRAEFVVANVTGQPFSPAVAERARDVEGVSEVAVVRGTSALVDGARDFLLAVDPEPYASATGLDVVEGSAVVADDGAVVGESRAERDGIGVGDTVRVELPAGSIEVAVVGIYADAPMLPGGFMVGLPLLERSGIAATDMSLYVLAEDGADLGSVQDGLEAATADLPTVTVQNHEEYKESSRADIDQLLAIVYALLGLAILIAILGIVNTLALSVMERRREVGLLRAVGMSRRQLRAAVRLESIAIAVLGAVLGVGLGLVFGLTLQRAIADDGLGELAVPIGQLGLFVALAAVVGVVAAAWPARRAARLDVLRAITAE